MNEQSLIAKVWNYAHVLRDEGVSFGDYVGQITFLLFDRAPAGEEVATKALWVYDFRTNKRFTLRERPLVRADLDDFVAFYKSGRLFEREEGERFKRFAYDDLIKRDKLNLDIFWLKDDAHIDPDSLPPPDEVAAEIVENLELALEKFRSVALSLALKLEG